MSKQKTLEELKREMDEAERKLACLKYRQERLENRKRYYEKGERAKRTHRLCNIGGAVESLAPKVRELPQGEMYALMESIFSLPEVKAEIKAAGKERG